MAIDEKGMGETLQQQNKKPDPFYVFAEFTEIYQIQADFETRVEEEFNKMIDIVTADIPEREANA